MSPAGKSFIDILEKGDDALALALVALDTIDGMTESKVDDVASAIVAGVRAVIALAKAGLGGEMSPDEFRAKVVAERDELSTKLAANDAAADAALYKRFPEGEP